MRNSGRLQNAIQDVPLLEVLFPKGGAWVRDLPGNERIQSHETPKWTRQQSMERTGRKDKCFWGIRKCKWRASYGPLDVLIAAVQRFTGIEMQPSAAGSQLHGSLFFTAADGVPQVLKTRFLLIWLHKPNIFMYPGLWAEPHVLSH